MDVVHVPVTEQEATGLLLQSVNADQSIPLVWGLSGCSIAVSGQGNAAWALRCLARMRGVDMEAI